MVETQKHPRDERQAPHTRAGRCQSVVIQAGKLRCAIFGSYWSLCIGRTVVHKCSVGITGNNSNGSDKEILLEAALVTVYRGGEDE